MSERSTQAGQRRIAALSAKLAASLREHKEALEREAATADILRALSRASSDLQPVFDAIVKHAHRLCGAVFSVLYGFDGTKLSVIAESQSNPRASKALRAMYPVAPSREHLVGRAVLDREFLHTEDAQTDRRFPANRPGRNAFTRLVPYRAGLAMPLTRGGSVIGAIAVARLEPRPFTRKEMRLVQTFADQAVIAIENARLFKELEEKNGVLAAALNQQTATSEILRSMSTSLTDVQPVFDTIVQSGLRLLGGYSATLTLLRGGELHLAAYTSTGAAGDDSVTRFFPVSLADLTPAQRAVRERRTQAIEDVETARFSRSLRATVRARGWRSALFVPMIRGSDALGILTVTRRERGPFAADEAALLEIFASQAVIAIENVRLFNETKESLEQQTAIAEVLRVISSSPTDVQPVLDAVAARAARICEAFDATIFLREGTSIRHVSHFGDIPPGSGLELGKSVPLARDMAAGRAILDGIPVHIEDLTAMAPKEWRRALELQKTSKHRTMLAVPLMREDRALGAILLRRMEVRPFTEKQIALLKTFADQAAIAIENVRLFNETKEALERQTAMAEILKVISSSPTDVQPVFAAIARSAVRLCDGLFANVFRYEGGLVHYVASEGLSQEGISIQKQKYPMPPDRSSVSGRVILGRSVVRMEDSLSDAAYDRSFIAAAGGPRRILGVPMLRAEEPRGAIVVAWESPGPISPAHEQLLTTFADQAAIAIENVRLFNETKEALERQTATSDVLRVISSSPTDVQPVLDSIAERAAVLCRAKIGFVARYDGALLLHMEAFHGTSSEGLQTMRTLYPMDPKTGGSVAARVILAGAPVQVPDVFADAKYVHTAAAKEAGFRSLLGVPLVREGQIVGAIVVAREETGLFPEKQVELLKTFADQAVIAIENARLFNETKEALEQQKATADVLGVIAGSPTNTQPVFEAIAASCVRLFGGKNVTVALAQGDKVELAAFATAQGVQAPEKFEKLFPLPLDESTVTGRAILSGKVVYVPDVEADPNLGERTKALARGIGYRNILCAPMIREGKGIGTINVIRDASESLPYSEKQVALLRTFAAQAVIAIENVRLFNETKEALERQTATAEILRVISSTPTDTQPVFEAIVATGLRVLPGTTIAIALVEGDAVRVMATGGYLRGDLGLKVPAGRDSATGIAIADRRVVHIRDTEAADVPRPARENGRRLGYRSMAVTPMLREGRGIGAISILLKDTGGLPDKQLELLKTFADQAVIAIENVRLFKELQARTEALAKSVDQLTALGEVGQAISSTLDVETVLKTIVSRAVQLTGLDGGTIYEYEEASRDFHLRAAENMPEALMETYRRMPIRLGEGIVGAAAVRREPVQVPDIQQEGYQTRYKELLLRQGYRAILAVPLLRDEQIVGALTVSRNRPGSFPPEVIELLRTFATQSALAIQNARLFREIAEKGRQLEVASRHKSQFLASMSHELRTPLNAILGFNEMILDQVYGEIPADVRAPLENMQASGKHLLRLINNVLDLAKIEAGRMELALADYSVQDTVANVRSTLAPLAAEKGLQFLARVPDNLPLAYGDGGRIAQCLLNLAGNSLKFTKQGSVEISVALADGSVRYTVADTGIGIPPDKVGSLFTEFKQTDATIASEYGGTGLGLSITKKFIEMHGGRIWVQSEPGKGSAFTFEVPLRAGDRS